MLDHWAPTPAPCFTLDNEQSGFESLHNIKCWQKRNTGRTYDRDVKVKRSRGLPKMQADSGVVAA